MSLVRRPLFTLLVVGGVSEVLYLYLSRFEAINGRPVWTFLAVSGALFGAYAIAAVVTSKDEVSGGRLLLLVISFGLLFRLTESYRESRRAN